MDSLALMEFDPATMPLKTLAVILARRGSGKSTLVADLLYGIRNRVAIVIVICPTEKSEPFYKKFIPDCFIYDDFNMSILARIKDRQDKVRASPPPGYPNTDILVILDDCQYKQSLFNHELMRYFICNGRHDGIGLWLIGQFITAFPPYIRSNADYVYSFKDTSRVSRENLAKMFFGFIPFKEFDPIHKFYTDDYGILILNNREPSGEPAKMMQWYKAQMRPLDWRLGVQAAGMYRFHELHYVEDQSAVFDWAKYKPQTLKSKSNGPPGIKLTRLDKDGQNL